MAQQGYGLSNAVGGFFDTYFKAKQLRQQEDQFNRNMAEEQRQSSLLNEYRMATLQAKQPTTEYQNFSQEGYYKIEPGKEPTYIQNQEGTSTPSEIYLGYGEAEGSPYKGYKYGYRDATGKEVIKRFQADKPREGSSGTTKEYDPDKTREKIVSQFSNYQSLTNELSKKTQFQLITKNTNELIRKRGLNADVSNIWANVKSKGLEESIKIADKKRQSKGKPPLSSEDIDDLSLYFTTRNFSSTPKKPDSQKPTSFIEKLFGGKDKPEQKIKDRYKEDYDYLKEIRPDLTDEQIEMEIKKSYGIN
jgi:hypothetical protein